MLNMSLMKALSVLSVDAEQRPQSYPAVFLLPIETAPQAGRTCHSLSKIPSVRTKVLCNLTNLECFLAPS